MSGCIVYFSLTGNTRRFVNKILDLKPDVTIIELKRFEPLPQLTQPYLLVVPTYVSEITQPVRDFLEYGRNLNYCQGIYGGGNRNFAELYCFTAFDLEREYHVPVKHCFEFQGTNYDVKKLLKDVSHIA